jgi:predicted TIM-barrel fold metal-dependent hydrolase
MREWIDTHLHLLDPGRLHYDWTDGVPALRGAFSLDTYRAQARPLGITQAIHMEVDVRESEIEAETAWVDSLAGTHGAGPHIVGMISACRPELPGFAEFLERQSATPRLRGFRRVLHTMPSELSTQPLFRDNLKRLEGSGYSFDLCMLASQLDRALELVRLYPGLSFVVDHCGVPDVAASMLEPWRSRMRELAQQPNVNCKISGVIAYGNVARWPEGDVQAIVRDLRPFVEHSIDCFGWDRVVWGSDWPVCTQTRGLGAWMAATEELLRGCTDAHIDALAHGNARRIYRLDGPR